MTSRAIAAVIGLAAAAAASTAAWAATTANLTATGSVAATCSVTGDTVAMTLQNDGSLYGSKADSAVSLYANTSNPVFALSVVNLTDPGNSTLPQGTLSVLNGGTTLLTANRSAAGNYNPGTSVNLQGLTLTGAVTPAAGALRAGNYALDATLSCTA